MARGLAVHGFRGTEKVFGTEFGDAIRCDAQYSYRKLATTLPFRSSWKSGLPVHALQRPITILPVLPASLPSPHSLAAPSLNRPWIHPSIRACPFSSVESRMSRRVYMFQPSVIAVMPIAASITPTPMIAQNSALRPLLPAAASVAMPVSLLESSWSAHATPTSGARQYPAGTTAAGNPISRTETRTISVGKESIPSVSTGHQRSWPEIESDVASSQESGSRFGSSCRRSGSNTRFVAASGRSLPRRIAPISNRPLAGTPS